MAKKFDKNKYLANKNSNMSYEELELKINPTEYIAREHREDFDWDRFKTDNADMPIGKLQELVNGSPNGIDFQNFYNNNKNTSLNKIEEEYENSRNFLGQYENVTTPNIKNTVINNDNYKSNNKYENNLFGYENFENYSKPYDVYSNLDVGNDEINYHSVYGNLSNRIDVGEIGTGIVTGKYENQSEKLIMNNYIDSMNDELFNETYLLTENDKINRNKTIDDVNEYFDDQYGTVKNVSQTEIPRVYNDITNFKNENNTISRVNDTQKEIENYIETSKYVDDKIIKEERKKIQELNNRIESEKENRYSRIDAEQQEYNQELFDAQAIVDERKVVEAYENEIFKGKFGTSKEKYADEISKAFDERDRIEKAKERMLDDDLYFQYDENDEFYKDVNVLNKNNIDNTKKVYNEKEQFSSMKNEKLDAEPEDFYIDENDKDNNKMFELMENEKLDAEPEDFEPEEIGEEPEEIEEKINRLREDGAEVTTDFENDKQKISSVKYGPKQKEQTKQFDYNKKTDNTINAEDYAKKIYGKDATDNQVRQLVKGYAESDANIKSQLYEDGFDPRKVNMNINGKSSEAIGRVIADIHKDDENLFFINKNKESELNTDYGLERLTEVQDGFDLDNMNKGYKSQAFKNRFQKEFRSKEADFVRMSEDIDKSYGDVKDIVQKISNKEVLTPEEAKAFHKYQVKLNIYKNEVTGFAEKIGYSPESVFGEGFKNKTNNNNNNNKRKASTKDTTKYEGSRDWSFNKTSINNINSHLKNLDIKVNLETGEYLRHSEIDAENNLDELKTLENNVDYNKAVKESGINKDNYLEFLKNNQDALTNDESKKLYRLKQQGIDIGENGEKILEGLAISKKGGLNAENSSVAKINKALETISSTEGYMNISDDNIERVGKDLTYEDGKYKLRKVDIKEPTEEINKIINSENIGTENIKKVLDQEELEKAIKEGNFEDTKTFNESVKNRFDTLEDSKYSTGFDMKKQLTKLQGVDEKIADEIVSAKANNSFDDLSVDAKVALSKMKDIDEDMLNYGNLDKENITKMWNNNKEFFGGLTKEKIENMSKEELAKMFGETLEKNNVGVLASGYKFKISGKDLNKEKDFAEFFDQIIDNEGKITFAKLADMMYIDEMGSFGTEETVKLLKEGKSWKEVQQAKLAKDAIGFLTESLSKGSEKLDGAKKEAVDKAIKQLKTKKMEDVMKDSLDMDKMSKYAGKIEKIGGNSNGIIDGIKGFKPSGKMLGTVAAVGAIAGIGMFASNAAEERERKRQEMQQLMMAQNQAIRGGY